MSAKLFLKLKRLTLALVVAELAYLALFNTALQLPLTQTVVNMVRPEKFHVSWERAWTWYPFRVHAEGIRANGQSRTQQWELSTPRASGSIRLLPLLLKRVWINNVTTVDVDYRQRPRLKPDKNYSARLEFFPEISDRVIQPAETGPRKKRRPWHLAMKNISASGQHSVWIYEARTRLEGQARADLSYQTRGGPFSLDAREIDLQVERLLLNNDREVFREGRFSGELAFAPFVPRENKGLSVLAFLILDLAVDARVDSLAFINVFTLSFEGLIVDGNGRVDGRLRYDQGDLLPGTDLLVDADDLRVALLDHRIKGDGIIGLDMTGAGEDAFRLLFEFQDLEVIQAEENHPVLVGQHLELLLGGDSYILPDRDRLDKQRRLRAVVDGLTVPDLALLQRYMPPQSPMRLVGGVGRLQGHADLSSRSLSVAVLVDSDAAHLASRDYHFTTDLKSALKLENPDYPSVSTSLAGSYLELGQVHLSRGANKRAESWDASLRIDEGAFSLISPQRQGEGDLFQALRASDFREALEQSKGYLRFEGEVSQLRWLGLFIESELLGKVRGHGLLDGVLHLRGGLPAADTDVRVRSGDLSVEVLDYRAEGEGKVRLEVTEGSEQVDWGFDISLDKARLLRRGESEGVVEDVSIRLNAGVDDVRRDNQPRLDKLRLRIDSAAVADMAVFNGFLPPDAPLQFLSGEAALTADILLHPDDASGWLKLEGERISASVDDQTVAGDISANILFRGGRPADMVFDIAGSSLLLDNVLVRGRREDLALAAWSTQLDLNIARIQWRKPLELQASATLRMSDTRPFVAMFDNLKWRPPFLAPMLLAENIEGEAKLEASGDVFVFPDVAVSTEHLEVAAKGLIADGRRDGMFYLRYRKADALLKIHNGARNVDIIKARNTFDTYRVPSLVHSSVLQPVRADRPR